MNRTSSIFLVLLRLALGWTLLVEGLEKVLKPDWTGEPYLREATGPLAPFFRWIAGDPVEDYFAVPLSAADQESVKSSFRDRIPPALERDWQRYFDRFVVHYGLTNEQREEARKRFEKAQEQTVAWMVAVKKPIEKTMTNAPPVKVEKTPIEWRAEYGKLRQQADQVERTELAEFGAAAEPRYSAIRSEIVQIRTALLGTSERTAGWLDQIAQVDKAIAERKKLAADLKQLIAKLAEKTGKSADDPKKPVDFSKLDSLGKELVYLRNRQTEVAKELDDLKSSLEVTRNDLDLSKHAALMRRDLKAILTAEQKKLADIPDIVRPGWDIRQWRLLDWADTTVKYGLTAIGICLIVGLFTQTACGAGGLLLLLFFLARMPLPGSPANPRAEGTYLYINKTFVEALALFALATIPTGRWLGLDGLLGLLRRRRPPSEGHEPPGPESGASERPDTATEGLTAPAAGTHNERSLPAMGGEGRGEGK